MEDETENETFDDACCGFGDCKGCVIRIPTCSKCSHKSCLGCNLLWCDTFIGSSEEINLCCDGRCTYTKRQQTWAYNHLVASSH